MKYPPDRLKINKSLVGAHQQETGETGYRFHQELFTLESQEHDL